jgi:hypothetical protein
MLKFFHANDHFVFLKPNSRSTIRMQFVPLKQTARHCSVVLSNSELGDMVFSVTGSVNKPLPILPETVQQHHYTVVNSETRTLHLSAIANSDFKEDIIIRNCNVSLENALLELSKWELDENTTKRNLLRESLHYAALSHGFSKLHVNDFLEISTTGPDEVIVFSVEGSDSKHFRIPHQVNVPISGPGELLMLYMWYWVGACGAGCVRRWVRAATCGTGCIRHWVQACGTGWVGAALGGWVGAALGGWVGAALGGCMRHWVHACGTGWVGVALGGCMRAALGV